MNASKPLLLLCMAFLLSQVGFAQDFMYIGASKCKMCHNSEKSGFQYKIWSESAHANAMKSLSNEKSIAYAKEHNIADPTKEASCLKCHSTAAAAPAELIETISVDEGVSCESCHGPGSAYKPSNIMKNRELSIQNGMLVPNEQTCLQCHNEENPFHKPFDYALYSKKIAHPIPTP